MNFSEFFKKRRIELGLTVRKFAQTKGYDVGYISRLENGLIAPPADTEKVKTLGKALEIKESSKNWTEFLDLVAIARSEIPEDLRQNEMAIKMLPAFYRSLRKKNLDEKEVEKLIDLLEDSREE
ncbi:MAG: helix-turn-helix domain-containing protein [Candidatus Saccharibacteria bacterium]|nr:helix-turn-helix domain-containing protein [Candidatus Saccharibacteria bacterium]